METELWIAIGTIFVVVWIWLGWEAYSTPSAPDDYDKHLDQFDRNEDEEYSEGKWNHKVQELGRNKNSLLDSDTIQTGIHSSKGTKIGTYKDKYSIATKMKLQKYRPTNTTDIWITITCMTLTGLIVGIAIGTLL